MNIRDIKSEILRFFENPRFRGLWYVRRREGGVQWTVTYIDDDGEYMETEDASTWVLAMIEAMAECKA